MIFYVDKIPQTDLKSKMLNQIPEPEALEEQSYSEVSSHDTIY